MEKESLNVGPKLPYLGIFRQKKKKTKKNKLISHLKQSRNFQYARFCAKSKILKLGTKSALFGCFGQQF